MSDSIVRILYVFPRIPISLYDTKAMRVMGMPLRGGTQEEGHMEEIVNVSRKEPYIEAEGTIKTGKYASVEARVRVLMPYTDASNAMATIDLVSMLAERLVKKLESGGDVA